MDRWGRGSYARYGGGDRGRESGQGHDNFHGYSDIRDKGPQITATSETQEDITLDTESEQLVNWKDQVFNVMKDLRESIMVDEK